MGLKVRELLGKPWFEAVLLCVEDLGKVDFTLADIYTYEDVLSLAFPQNNNVQAKIRQTLQYLRDAEIIEFKKKGEYKIVATELLPDHPADFAEFNVTPTPAPDAPKKNVKESPRTLVGIPTPKDDLDRLRDARLGEAGEQVVLQRERKLLVDAGSGQLAEKVEQVSKTKGDYIGYDVLSFLPSGQEKWIEVKTTRGKKASRFHISENQVATSETNPEVYQLHRLYDFDLASQTSKLFIVEGNLRQQLSLLASSYIGSLN